MECFLFFSPECAQLCRFRNCQLQTLADLGEPSAPPPAPAPSPSPALPLASRLPLLLNRAPGYQSNTAAHVCAINQPDKLFLFFPKRCNVSLWNENPPVCLQIIQQETCTCTRSRDMKAPGYLAFYLCTDSIIPCYQ